MSISYLVLVVIVANVKAEPDGYCASYNGKICSSYLNNTGFVWYNMSNDNTGGWLNEQITTGLWEEMIIGLKEPCRSAAEVNNNVLRDRLDHMHYLSETSLFICLSGMLNAK